MRNLSGYERLRMEQGYEPTPDNTPRYPDEDTVIIHKRYVAGDSYAYLGQMNDYTNRRRVYVLYCVIESEVLEATTFDRIEADVIFDEYVEELKRL